MAPLESTRCEDQNSNADENGVELRRAVSEAGGCPDPTGPKEGQARRCLLEEGQGTTDCVRPLASQLPLPYLFYTARDV